MYRLGDELSGGLILPMLVFSPWAFGTTQPWAIWGMNFAGYLLGAFLLVKLFIRHWKQYPAARWDRYSTHSGLQPRQRHESVRRLTQVLGALTLAVLAFILVSALNVAANYNGDARVFQYHPYIHWLPHSFDGQRTWFLFWMYLGLAASFWSVVDWLPGMTAAEERGRLTGGRDGGSKEKPALPGRLRLLLWVLCINGAVLGAECIFQRASGSTKLLFLEQPKVNWDGESQFGPYAYRSNAAQYFNLLWPLCFGFWWTLQRLRGWQSKALHGVLLCTAVMAACPIISTSRGGAIVSAGMLFLAVAYLAVSGGFRFGASPGDGASRKTTGGLILFVVVTLGLGGHFGWSTLSPRMQQISQGYDNREAMYEAARPMAADYPLYGTGPGTFATVFQLYLISTDTYWPEQLHNDWLETRITFGWVGFGLLLAALACVALRGFLPGGIRGSRRFVVLTWLALGGCLIHALFDFPFQIHSTLFLFLVLCAILFNLGGAAGGSRR